MKKSSSIKRRFLQTSLVILCLLVLAGEFAPASAAEDKRAATSAMKRRLARISRKLNDIESRLLTDDAVAVMAQSMSAHVVEPIWLPSAPLKGRIVFEQKNCDRCHAISGAGGSTGPDLSRTFFQGSFLDLASMLWNHIPDMLVEYKAQKLTRPTYTEEEVANLTSYLYYLRYLGNPGDVARGEKLLEEKSCVKCHVPGNNGNDLGPSFDRIKRYASPLELAQALWNHEPKMHEMMRRLGIARPTFTGQEISDLSAFVRAASRSTQTERIYVSPGNPQDGAKVYQKKGCANCHSTDHSDAPLLASLPLHKSAADIAGMMWNHGEQMFVKMQAGAIDWPIFEGKEMADLIAYLYFVKFIEPPGNAVVGRTFFQEKKCGACHSIQGVGGSVGPDLALGSAHTSNIGILTAMLNHSETMSEAVLNRGDSWPLLSGREMRDTFAYIKAVSGIKRATEEAAARTQGTVRPSPGGSSQPNSAQPSLVPQTPSSSTRTPTGPSRSVVADAPARARDLPTIPNGYQVVDALLETARGTGLIQKLKDSLGEDQMKRVKLSFQRSPEFISKADFTWKPRNLEGVQQIRIFVPTLSDAGLTVRLNGEIVWNPPDKNGRNILSPQIDLDLGEPKLSVTIDDHGDNGINGGVDEIYILRPTTN